MISESLARRYAAAVFSLADQSHCAPAVGNDLRILRDAIYAEETAQRFFLSPVVDRREKERVLAKAFAGKASDIALHTLLLLVRKRREALLSEIVRQYGKLEMRARGAEPLTVTSAKHLSRDEFSELVARLEQIYGKRFEAEQHVDPHLIGGLRIMMGDRRIDGSIDGRLRELSRTLFARN